MTTQDVISQLPAALAISFLMGCFLHLVRMAFDWIEGPMR